MIKDLSIRKATRNDIPSIYELVKELALYEKEPEAVTATLEDYYIHFDDKIFKAIVAEKESEIIGMMLYFTAYSTWKGKMIYLDDFVVNAKYRKSGIGQKLYQEFLKIAKDEGAKMVKWQVLDWNEPAINFYKKNNAILEDGWLNVKLYL